MTVRSDTPQVAFGDMLEKVAGSAFRASGFTLQDNATHQARGLFRYRKDLADGVSVYVEFQLLFYKIGGPSRFRVNLLRNKGADARTASSYQGKVDTTLGKLLWEDFGVQTLGTPDAWWTFNTAQELATALVEAGKLVIGFGIPWLEGTLLPGDET